MSEMCFVHNKSRRVAKRRFLDSKKGIYDVDVSESSIKSEMTTETSRRLNLAVRTFQFPPFRSDNLQNVVKS